MSCRWVKMMKRKAILPKNTRDPTLRHEISKKRSEGMKINIQYNNDGKEVGEGSVQNTSYMDILVQTMVLVYYTNWRVVVLIELKENL